METYDATKTPPPDEWLALDESLRIDLVKDYHAEIGDSLPEEESATLHAAIHVVIENQLAMGEAIVQSTLAKLIRQGLDRHDAIHAIGAIISGELFDVLKHSDGEFSVNRYRRRLEKLTAKRWRKGKW